jgi:protein gp37
MSEGSKIEWTDNTWNPVRGCTKVSQGCKHCYAHTFAERFRGVPGHPFEQGFDLRLVPEKLLEPFKWSSSRLVFVNSMSDLFHKDIPDEYIVAVCKVMELANWHTYQVLTKRSRRMAELLTGKLAHFATCGNIWWGVSVEDHHNAAVRIPDLQRAPVKGRFLSAEPLLGDLGSLSLDGIGWVIVGGESGPGARPVDRQWGRSIRDQCTAAGVPFFFKQWGGTRKKVNGKELDGRTWDEKPAFVANPVPTRTERLRLKGEMETQMVKLSASYPIGQIPVLTAPAMVA